MENVGNERSYTQFGASTLFEATHDLNDFSAFTSSSIDLIAEEDLPVSLNYLVRPTILSKRNL
jgi:hypothetical protein